MSTPTTSHRRRRRLASVAALVSAFTVVLVGFGLERAQHSRSVTDTVSETPNPAEQDAPSALFVGDSYTQGTGAADPHHGYACLTAKAMGWHCDLDTQGGTGFINDGSSNDDSFVPFAARLQADRRRFLADVVVIDGGRNDGRYPAEEVIAAADSYVHQVRQLWPRAAIVMIVPEYLWNTPEEDTFGVHLAVGLRAIAREVGGLVVDPLDERWVSPAQVAAFLWKDDIHPNAQGHSYLAQRLTAALREGGLATLPLTDGRHPSLKHSPAGAGSG